MKVLTKEELQNVQGGAITASLISAAAKAINSILELGRSLGTAIRRVQNGSVCSL